MTGRHILTAAALCISTAGNAQSVTFTAHKKYLNIPVAGSEQRSTMRIEADGRAVREFSIRLAAGQPDYWVFTDISALKGKRLTLRYDGNASGLSRIYQDSVINGADSIYRESKRPLFHFTARRGWINDPNGLIWHEGEYHLFYQHNPYEREWENMHWGHAVSGDLIHWRELPEAIYPDHLGAAFSGTAVIDHNNTAGFGYDAMIAIYTAASPQKQVQCLAYSNDNGRTWTKYAGNPVVDSRDRWQTNDTRDPKVFRYRNSHWVMVLNERDGHSIYTSPDLKRWTYQSHTTPFWECPDLFELAVDGNPADTRWVMYGASGTYMIGRFDGKTFTPEGGKYRYVTGSLYAAQTFANISDADGRRIQIGWGRIPQPASTAYNNMMLLPTELTLRTTSEGIRLFSVPVMETALLHDGDGVSMKALNAKAADSVLLPFANADALRIRATLHLSHATSAALSLDGQNLLDYDLNSNTLNGAFYAPYDRTSMDITADIFIDRTSIEVFIDNGAYSYSMARQRREGNTEGFRWHGHRIEVKSITIIPLHSIYRSGGAFQYYDHE